MDTLIITPKAEDFLVGRVLDSKWYQWKISDIQVGPNKKDPSKNNLIFSFTCIGGEDMNGPAAGCVAKDKYFVLDAKGQGYLIAFGRQIGLQIADGQKFDVMSWKENVTFDALSGPSEYNGKTDNELKGFAPLGKMSNL